MSAGGGRERSAAVEQKQRRHRKGKGATMATIRKCSGVRCPTVFWIVQQNPKGDAGVASGPQVR